MSSSAALTTATEQLVTRLKRRQTVGAYETAVQTLHLLRQAVSQTRFTTVEAIIDVVRSIGRTLSEAAPLELSIGNTVRRVLRVIREEGNAEGEGESGVERPSGGASFIDADDGYRRGSSGMPALGVQVSMYNLLAEAPKPSTQENKPHSDFKGAVIEALNQMLDELEQLYTATAQQALEHIHSNEIILTIGMSRTVTEFFKAAARKRKFQVIVAETAPWYDGQRLAVELAKFGIDTTVITDAAIFAMMARVNKVIVGTHAVLANGGLIARSGTHIVASAAKHHGTPVVVVTGLFKLAPLYAFDQDTFNSLASPASALLFEDALFTDNVNVAVPFFDYIPPELVSLFVTNMAGHPPSYIYRLLGEQYHPEDYVI